MPGQQFEFDYDDIGNRLTSSEGGDASGTGLRQSSYVPNDLNQYSSRSISAADRKVDVMGLALVQNGTPTTVTIQVDGGTAVAPDYRRGEYFWKAVAAGGSGPNWLNLNVVDGSSSSSGNVYVSPQSESYTPDADGNVIGDARWVYKWDAENRLARMDTQASAAAAGIPAKRIQYTYDYQGRMIRRQVFSGTYSSGAITWNSSPDTAPGSDLIFLYDGFQCIAALNTADQSLYQAYVWGVGASGVLSGAGGVGGLLMFRTASQTYFPTYDGNGNVMGLVNGSDGTVVARYEYGPFGNLLRVTGEPVALDNPFRFSSKWQDDQSDLLYYGFRWYSSYSGRWLSRDPIRELGGLNLYAFVYNDPADIFDYLGREGYWTDVGTTFKGEGRGALAVGKQVGYFAGDLVLGFIVVVTPDCCCDKLLTKLDELGYKGSSLTAQAGGRYGGIKTAGKVFIAPVVAAVSVPVNGYQSVEAALNGDLNAAGNKMGQALTTGGLLAAPFAKGAGGTGGYTGVGTLDEAMYNLTPTLFKTLPKKVKFEIVKRAGSRAESCLIRNMGQSPVTQLQIRPLQANGSPTTWWFTADGVCRANGSFMIREFKASPTAPLTSRQTQAFPLLERYGGVVRGIKGGERRIPQGTLLPPIRVQIIRQTQFQPGELVLPALGENTSQ